ncbi:signal recognition particle-docking protein FtsY [Rhodococcus sp. X156]|uniref:signal recognition particle-docking protein FtsY n=1 Tax=Rhodococcus sp. X156 TaxID=2499145 RepID=UPI000FDC8A60|nr:signal recognition particle-docking protein FtsY [Rhodococcus sp. X156]
METWVWIVIAVAALLILLLVAGLVLRRRRQVRLSVGQRESTATPTGYRADRPISFSGGSTAPPAPSPVAPTLPETPESPETEREPAVGDDASIPRDSERRTLVNVDLPDAETAAAAPRAPVETEAAAPETAETDTAAPETAAPETETAAPETETVETAETETVTPEPTAEPREEIAPTAGRLDRLRGRLSRSQSAVGQSLLGLLGAGDLDEDSWEEVEDTLLMADLGTATTVAVVTELREKIASRNVRTTEQARALLREVLVNQLHPEMDRSIAALPHADHPSVLLVVGVNGTGKTTTTGKLARVLVADGRRVLLGAADTFRAAAADQLQTWGERVGAEVVRGKESADPAAVAFDAVAKGTELGVDVVLIDTAGRLHTKTGLMDELGKVKRVVEKKAAVDEVLLVLDATTGQNGLLQARVFSEVVTVTGVVLTKLDGTAKGGIVFQVQRELGVPVKLVGLGEGADDLAPFVPEAFIDALLG